MSENRGFAGDVSIVGGIQIPRPCNLRKREISVEITAWERLLPGYHFNIMDYTVFHVAAGFSKQAKENRMKQASNPNPLLFLC